MGRVTKKISELTEIKEKIEFLAIKLSVDIKNEYKTNELTIEENKKDKENNNQALIYDTIGRLQQRKIELQNILNYNYYAKAVEQEKIDHINLEREKLDELISTYKNINWSIEKLIQLKGEQKDDKQGFIKKGVQFLIDNPDKLENSQYEEDESYKGILSQIKDEAELDEVKRGIRSHASTLKEIKINDPEVFFYNGDSEETKLDKQLTDLLTKLMKNANNTDEYSSYFFNYQAFNEYSKPLGEEESKANNKENSAEDTAENHNNINETNIENPRMKIIALSLSISLITTAAAYVLNTALNLIPIETIQTSVITLGLIGMVVTIGIISAGALSAYNYFNPTIPTQTEINDNTQTPTPAGSMNNSGTIVASLQNKSNDEELTRQNAMKPTP